MVGARRVKLVLFFKNKEGIGGGARDAPLCGPNFFIFVQFSGKNCQIVGRCPPVWEILDLPLEGYEKEYLCDEKTYIVDRRNRKVLLYLSDKLIDRGS